MFRLERMLLLFRLHCPWRCLRALLSMALLAAGPVCVPTSTATAMTLEMPTFVTNVVPNTLGDRPVMLQTRLFLPDAPTLPMPSVVITPSSGGVRFDREIYYAEELARAGIAALVIDSFGSRGLSNSVFDQRLLTQWQSSNDAIAGLKWLHADARFKKDRIGVLGVSKGGIVALDTALPVRRRWMRVTDVAFAAHVAIAPGCTWINSSVETTGAPIFFMLAELDDVTPAKPCVERAKNLRAAGNTGIEVKVYKGAHHAWEVLGPRPIFTARMENYSKCRVIQGDDARMISVADGKEVPRSGWYEWALRSCVTRGGHCCGGTPELKRQATDDMIAFLKRNGF
jgi:dienelactone hydrolase